MNVLLLCGGDGSEHNVSLKSSEYLKSELSKIEGLNIIVVTIHNGQWLTSDNKNCHLQMDGKLLIDNYGSLKINYLVPCFHGYPGETGDIQSLFDLLKIPYLGCDSESSKLCYNKISTKLWLTELGIPNTPYCSIFDNSSDSKNIAIDALEQWGEVFVKAASQGSSVGCYKVNSITDLIPAIDNAFKYSNRVLIEKALKPRELEVAIYEYDNELIVTPPGEIIYSKNTFYTYEEKYSSDSTTSINVVADSVDDLTLSLITEYSKKIFHGFKLKDLSRIDFFISDNRIFVNEINTFPGMTNTSLFPKMLENSGISMVSFLENRIRAAI